MTFNLLVIGIGGVGFDELKVWELSIQFLEAAFQSFIFAFPPTNHPML